MECYFQGCAKEGNTREHVPPRAFFPENQRKNLITVNSCIDHNNTKSSDDLYALAHICLNSSPQNRAGEVFMKSVLPQLEFNEAALKRYLIKYSAPTENRGVKYKVDIQRLNKFFNALSCGLIYHTAKKQLPQNFSMRHAYHNLTYEPFSLKDICWRKILDWSYKCRVPEILHFGVPRLVNEEIYTATIFGIQNYHSSITIVHLFFGHFKVTSMLSLKKPQGIAPIYG